MWFCRSNVFLLFTATILLGKSKILHVKLTFSDNANESCYEKKTKHALLWCNWPRFFDSKYFLELYKFCIIIRYAFFNYILILFYFILFNFILFYFILFYTLILLSYFISRIVNFYFKLPWLTWIGSANKFNSC